jgi:CheY-like chemotaxis protein
MLDDKFTSPNDEKLELWQRTLKNVNEGKFILELYDSPSHVLDRVQSLGHNTIVILDMQMSEMDGADFLIKLRDNEITIPVIGYTANKNDELIQDLLKNDLFSYIRKGTKESRNELVEYINKAIEKFKDNIPLVLTDALDEYLSRKPERREKKIHTKDGRVIYFGDILEEMNNNTELGVDYQKALYKMSFEALFDGETQL